MAIPICCFLVEQRAKILKVGLDSVKSPRFANPLPFFIRNSLSRRDGKLGKVFRFSKI